MASLSAMRFDVVLVPFPFDDFSGQKVRPAVCLTDAAGTHRHIVLAFITSVVPASLEGTDLILDASTPGFARTGLKVPSVLRLHRLLTVAAAMIRRRLGVLSPDTRAEVRERLRTLFAL